MLTPKKSSYKDNLKQRITYRSLRTLYRRVPKELFNEQPPALISTECKIIGGPQVFCLNIFVFNFYNSGFDYRFNKINWNDLLFLHFFNKNIFHGPLGQPINIDAFFCTKTNSGECAVLFLTREPLMPSLPTRLTMESIFQPRSTALASPLTNLDLPSTLRTTKTSLSSQLEYTSKVFITDSSVDLCMWNFHETENSSNTRLNLYETFNKFIILPTNGFLNFSQFLLAPFNFSYPPEVAFNLPITPPPTMYPVPGRPDSYLKIPVFVIKPIRGYFFIVPTNSTNQKIPARIIKLLDKCDFMHTQWYNLDIF
jgi:hypothetical protein